jgi:superfamily II DNA or RNA helicase
LPSHVPAPGDLVWIRQRRWRVVHARKDDRVVTLDVVGRGRRLTFLTPFDRPTGSDERERLRRVGRPQALAWLAGLSRHAWSVRTMRAAPDAAVAVLPHQLEPALAILAGARRVLIADEVGLGKTIQAGLVIAELGRRRQSLRVLVLVPAAMRRQWADELTQKFGIACLASETAAIDAQARVGAPGENPWRRPGVWIASLDYMKQAHVMAALPLHAWDVVVVDEAHNACGDSERHRALDRLARSARRVLLLSATPHGGDAVRYERLRNIGALPDVADPLVVFRRTRLGLGLQENRRVRWPCIRVSDAQSRVLDTLVAFERAVLGAAGPVRRDTAVLLLSVFRKRALSTMSALFVTLERRLAWLDNHQPEIVADWHQPQLEFESQSDLTSPDERASLQADVGVDERQERSWLRRLVALTEAARRHDVKIARVTELAIRSREPVVIFTEFRHSLDAVRSAVERVRVVAVLHGGQPPSEQQRELDRFLGGEASALIATDVASQGLNLQSRARWVVNLELPWNPTRLEQRAGRVDRIGQQQPVHVTVLLTRHVAEATVVANLARRTLAARRAFGADTLGLSAPSDAVLRSAVLTGTAIADDAARDGTVEICRAFVRQARVAARAILSRRALSSRWRGALTDTSVARWTRIDHAPSIRSVARGSLFVFIVPLVDGAGDVVEQHVVAVRGPIEAGAGRPAQEHIEQARASAQRALIPRRRRLQHVMRNRLPVLFSREQAVAMAIASARGPARVQEGLFDRQQSRRAERIDRDVEAMREECGRQMRAFEEAASPTIGRPRLELVCVARR